MLLSHDRINLALLLHDFTKIITFLPDINFKITLKMLKFSEKETNCCRIGVLFFSNLKALSLSQFTMYLLFLQ